MVTEFNQLKRVQINRTLGNRVCCFEASIGCERFGPHIGVPTIPLVLDFETWTDEEFGATFDSGIVAVEFASLGFQKPSWALKIYVRKDIDVAFYFNHIRKLRRAFESGVRYSTIMQTSYNFMLSMHALWACLALLATITWSTKNS